MMRQSQALTPLDHEPPSTESERCPKCGGARLFTTNALTGAVIVSCPTCEQLAARRAARAKWEESAIAFVCAKYSITPEQLELRCTLELSSRAFRRRKQLPKCRFCEQEFERKGRGQRICDRPECQEAKRQRKREREARWRAAHHPPRKTGPRTYKTRPCDRCGRDFMPTGPAARYCNRADCTPALAQEAA